MENSSCSGNFGERIEKKMRIPIKAIHVPPGGAIMGTWSKPSHLAPDPI